MSDELEQMKIEIKRNREAIIGITYFLHLEIGKDNAIEIIKRLTDYDNKLAQKEG
jgi:hypothetical protein